MGLAGAVSLLAAAGCGGSGGGGGSGSASTVAPSTSATTPGALNLATGRALHTATLLPNGAIFVAGGVDSTGSALAETSLVTLNAVTSGPRLIQARVGCTATLLETGKILIAGGMSGVNAQTALDSTEIYDPLAGAISSGPKLTTPRSEAVAVTYGPAGSQMVLIAGGANGSTKLNTAETLDVRGNKTTALTAKLSEAVAGAEGARLDDGTIVLVGGDSTTGAAGAEIFDPTTQIFTATNVTIRRSGAAFVANGRDELVAGGASSTGVEKTTESYDIATRLFSQGALLNTARRDATASIVSSGVLVIGGRSATAAVNAIEVLSGATLAQSTVTAQGTLKTSRYGHTATVLSGKVLVIGGFDVSGTPLASIETVDPATIGARGGSVGTPTTGTTTTPTTRPTTLPPAPGGSGGGGLGSLLGGLLGGLTGGSSGGSLLGKIASAGIQTVLSQGFSGGIGGFLKAFAGNLLGQFFPPGSALGGIVGAIFPPSTPSSSSSGGLGGLLGGLFGGGGSSGGSGIGGVISSLFGGLFGGGSSKTPPPASGTAPTVASMTPAAGPVGTAVTITGTNFGTGASVTFKKKQGFFSKILGFITGGSGTTAATVTASTATTINLTVPSDADTGTVTVSAGGASVSAGTYTVQ